MIEELTDINGIITLLLGLLALYVAVKTNFIKPALLKLLGSNLNIVDVQFDENRIDLLLHNSHSTSVIVSSISVDVTNHFMKPIVGPEALHMLPSDQINILFDFHTSSIVHNMQLEVKPNSGDRIQLHCHYPSGHSRFLDFTLNLHSGGKKCASVKILDFVGLQSDYDPFENPEFEAHNRRVIAKVRNLKSKRTMVANAILDKYI